LFAEIQRKLILHVSFGQLFRCLRFHVEQYRQFSAIKIYYSLWSILSYKLADKVYRTKVVRTLGEPIEN
jgi:hypothetical protein